jgi:hypothetical protein
MHIKRSHACISNNTSCPPSMPPSSHPSFFHITSQVICHGWHVAHVIATHVCAWTCAIAIGVVMEIIEQMDWTMTDRAGRCVSFYFHFGNANVSQGEREFCYLCEQVLCPSQWPGNPPCTRHVCACHINLRGGHLPQPCHPLVGENGKFFLSFFLAWMFADFLSHSDSLQGVIMS